MSIRDDGFIIGVPVKLKMKLFLQFFASQLALCPHAVRPSVCDLDLSFDLSRR
jgi:hypothetical protein